MSAILKNARWGGITREERYFTSFLFHDLLRNSTPLLNELRKQIHLPDDVRVIDIGFEVCFFRDGFLGGWLKTRNRTYEKLTFDLALWLSNHEMIVIEAKAQQSFGTKQLKNLRKAASIIENDAFQRFRKVYIVGLVSDKYSPSAKCTNHLDATIHWSCVGGLFEHKDLVDNSVYARANEIHGNR